MSPRLKEKGESTPGQPPAPQNPELILTSMEMIVLGFSRAGCATHIPPGVPVTLCLPTTAIWGVSRKEQAGTLYYPAISASVPGDLIFFVVAACLSFGDRRRQADILGSWPTPLQGQFSLLLPPLPSAAGALGGNRVSEFVRDP